jgi:hypothetical protein
MDNLELTDIHKDDVIFENSQYGSVEVRVLTEPQLKGDEWTFTGATGLGENVNFLVNLKYRHYGPRFGKTPTYIPVTRLVRKEKQ